MLLSVSLCRCGLYSNVFSLDYSALLCLFVIFYDDSGQGAMLAGKRTLCLQLSFQVLVKIPYVVLTTVHGK